VKKEKDQIDKKSKEIVDSFIKPAELLKENFLESIKNVFKQQN
jgi:uncharacterized membrane-anchored protein YhcB (DUF1043 family)